jgi:uncharacterized cupredoxin-like copper-binding protein
VALLAWSGCGARHSAARAGGAGVRVAERDFHISAPKHLRPGVVRLSVRNRGPDDHELIVVKARSSRLPLRADGLTIDEDRLDSVKVGVLEPGTPGEVRQLELHLAPGHYVMFCNMSGHFLGGMHTELVVQ